ncbi:sensor histidine kinase [Fundicoccus culcitae]|uniref:histidine kinase n=1 Tax=Fundicoccus culcitae TaxID=2969821 RepID=A0ABY5P892_9LACT|nr:sensor histidine kinase [Fundicoccus culcitae]UUX34739.1 sensor histidine kinase [Fundicoccus culcitae]
MIAIKYVLLLLNLFQLIPIRTFWQYAFFWFFTWVIASNIQWFFLDNPKYKTIQLHIISLLTLINIAVLPTFPTLMLAVFVMDLRQIYSRRVSLYYLAFLTVILLLYYAFNTQAHIPTVDTLLITLATLLISLLLVEQNVKNTTLQAQLYEKSRQYDEQTENLQSLKSQMQTMEEIHTLNERNRISRDLHDSVGHTLSTIVIQLAAIQRLTAKTNLQASEMLKELHLFAKEGLGNVRKVIHEMKPSQYQKVAFIDQVQTILQVFEKNSQIMVYFNHNQLLWNLSPEQEQLVIRAVQEFLVNTTKHSQASEVRIVCHFTNDSLILTMSDNGQGTDTIKPQLGILGMQERAKLLGGKVHVQSAINQGFKIRIVLPKGGFAYEQGINQSLISG